MKVLIERAQIERLLDECSVILDGETYVDWSRAQRAVAENQIPPVPDAFVATTGLLTAPASLDALGVQRDSGAVRMSDGLYEVTHDGQMRKLAPPLVEEHDDLDLGPGGDGSDGGFPPVPPLADDGSVRRSIASDRFVG